LRRVSASASWSALRLTLRCTAGRALEAAVIKQLRRSLAIDDLTGLMRAGSHPVAPGGASAGASGAAAPAAPAATPSAAPASGVLSRFFGR
jgi:hypothetical protein